MPGGRGGPEIAEVDATGPERVTNWNEFLL